MRLLNAEFMTLESFNSKSDRPSYAILSHTWNENELIFEDLYTDDFTNLPGFSKVKQSCEQALRDGHSHIWIDTCCIDKRSSSELSEAINSMFQWYGEALECFAFLQDVYDYSDIEEFKWCPENYILTSTQLQKLKNSQFAKSRYWTRGWTLPEVIAPNSVVFYDHNFQRIGSRDELRRVVSVITGINENMFWEHVKLEEFSIATRMSWASNRETTRLEDMAYSLLGIFGIHMPMLYGEGKQAFVRLQEEIIKNSRDHSIFAWEGEVYSSNSNGFLFAQSPSAFRHSDNVISLQH
ncbi:heterokaryon incompatibility protein-domain-containing protein [Dendryphion nanum]|uniref:Heterokaryon incompatibility protein-domain-containing protein n=1 Tax=Dendryphion nanum TaxID=256645 RepID=A0A9P9DJ96_9PLEO|nr:heterokaryon incompatibility protein-domain-containing protein [Dendryphion nanum]